jgi:prepilin peptidase CpaA
MEAYLAMSAAPPLLAACLWDVRHRIIPDWTVMGVMASGVALALVRALGEAGADALVDAFAIGFLCLLLGALAARAGLWGWGDAKLIGAAGLVAGSDGVLALLLGTSIAGGAMALLLLLLRRPVRAGLLMLPAGAPRWLRVEQTRLRRHPTVPYAIAIAVGLVTALLRA